jgi:CRP-like cAMP-binding protein
MPESTNPSAFLQGGEAATGALNAVAVFAGIDRLSLDRIEARSRFVEVRDGAQILKQGDAADAIYAVISGGRVRVVTTSRDKGLMVQMFHAGDILGEMGVIDGGVRSADAYAEGRVRLLRISARIFLAALDEHPALGRNLCVALSTRLRRTLTLLEDATFENLEVRLARQILYLGQSDGRRTEHGLQLTGRLRQVDLADFLGTTNRSIITILHAWRTSGLVIYNANRGQLTVVDEAKLQGLVAANEEPAPRRPRLC